MNRRTTPLLATIGLAAVVVTLSALSAEATGLGAAPPAATPTAGQDGSISGTVYTLESTGGKHPENHLVLVVPASVKQPIDLAAYGSPADAAALPESKQGTGLVQPGANGRYSATALSPGSYLVMAIIPMPTYGSTPPEEFSVVLGGVQSTVRGFTVDVGAGQSVGGVDFVLASPAAPPATTGSLTIHIVTYDPSSLKSSPDNATTVTLDPPAPEAKITSGTDNAVMLENVPAGNYKVVIRTARGFAIEHSITITPGVHGEVTFGFSPPEPGGGGVRLPHTGGPDHGGFGSARLASWLTIAALLLSAGTGVGLFARFRAPRPPR